MPRGIIIGAQPALLQSDLRLREQALARWDDEGGARLAVPYLGDDTVKAPALTNTELVQLQVRMIALENLVIALLADSSQAQLKLARDMAVYISPRAGFTRHPLTLHAAAQMQHLVERAGYFQIGADG